MRNRSLIGAISGYVTKRRTFCTKSERLAFAAALEATCHQFFDANLRVAGLALSRRFRIAKGNIMPIVVESLQSATYQDQGDLQKIYRDAPPWLFAPFSDASQLIESALDHHTLIAARFNDRLLGAARLQKHGQVWELSHLCVRALTRRRGVAERLVIHAQKSAEDAGCTLRLLATVGSLEVQTLAAKLHVPLQISPVPEPGTSCA